LMDLDQIKQLLQLVREHDLAEFEIEQEGLRLRIRKEAGGLAIQQPVAPPGPAASPDPGHQAAAPAAGALDAIDADGADAGIELAVVKSPIVGTFYRSPEPGAPAFVEVGSVVRKGQVLCIIEAMKLMNEIDSEYDGEIVSIYAENGHAVQYGERLFAIRAK
jgi:acetyl-CoA carboxylase biotin carboxyl carrier protein